MNMIEQNQLQEIFVQQLLGDIHAASRRTLDKLVIDNAGILEMEKVAGFTYQGHPYTHSSLAGKITNLSARFQMMQMSPELHSSLYQRMENYLNSINTYETDSAEIVGFTRLLLSLTKGHLPTIVALLEREGYTVVTDVIKENYSAGWQDDSAEHYNNLPAYNKKEIETLFTNFKTTLLKIQVARTILGL